MEMGVDMDEMGVGLGVGRWRAGTESFCLGVRASDLEGFLLSAGVFFN